MAREEVVSGFLILGVLIFIFAASTLRLRNIDKLIRKLEGLILSQTAGPLLPPPEGIADFLQVFQDKIGDRIAIALSDHQNNSRTALVTFAAKLSREHGALRQLIEERLPSVGEATRPEDVTPALPPLFETILERQLGSAVQVIGERVDQLTQTAGELKALAVSINELKRTLANVKTRGTWGETSLRSLLELALTQEQFAANVCVTPTKSYRVDFAVRLHRGSSTEIWMPIDSKFPLDKYEKVIAAGESGHPADIEAAGKALENSIRGAARDVSRKYIHPPGTTDFAVIFLPIEGLFWEVSRRPRLMEFLQREYRVIVAGPGTLLALLNSVRIGLQLASPRSKSDEVQRTLLSLQSEFGKFGSVIDGMQRKLRETQGALDEIARQRRAVDRTLRTAGEAAEELSSAGSPQAPLLSSAQG